MVAAPRACGRAAATSGDDGMGDARDRTVAANGARRGATPVRARPTCAIMVATAPTGKELGKKGKQRRLGKGLQNGLPREQRGGAWPTTRSGRK